MLTLPTTLIQVQDKESLTETIIHSVVDPDSGHRLLLAQVHSPPLVGTFTYAMEAGILRIVVLVGTSICPSTGHTFSAESTAEGIAIQG